jgi:hypothetical protein
MSNIHTLSSLSSSSTSKKSGGTQIGSRVYKTEGLVSGLNRIVTSAGKKKLGSIKQMGSISGKLSKALGSGGDTELDKQLKSQARLKQQVDLPMTPELRLLAIERREPIKPARELTCPQGHKLASPKVRLALDKSDVYTCSECHTACGGADAHPLHLEFRILNPIDKNKYVDSVRWFSRSDVNVQTREYIKGHPLVYPHLAAGVLMNDETDAWHGYALGLNIYYCNDTHNSLGTHSLCICV